MPPQAQRSRKRHADGEEFSGEAPEPWRDPTEGEAQQGRAPAPYVGGHSREGCEDAWTKRLGPKALRGKSKTSKHNPNKVKPVCEDCKIKYPSFGMPRPADAPRSKDPNMKKCRWCKACAVANHPGAVNLNVQPAYTGKLCEDCQKAKTGSKPNYCLKGDDSPRWCYRCSKAHVGARFWDVKPKQGKNELKEYGAILRNIGQASLRATVDARDDRSAMMRAWPSTDGRGNGGLAKKDPLSAARLEDMRRAVMNPQSRTRSLSENCMILSMIIHFLQLPPSELAAFGSKTFITGGKPSETKIIKHVRNIIGAKSGGSQIFHLWNAFRDEGHILVKDVTRVSRGDGFQSIVETARDNFLPKKRGPNADGAAKAESLPSVAAESIDGAVLPVARLKVGDAEAAPAEAEAVPEAATGGEAVLLHHQRPSVTKRIAKAKAA